MEFLRDFLDFKKKLGEIFGNFSGVFSWRKFLGGIFCEKFFGGFFRRIFSEDFFERIFFGRFFGEEFFVCIGIDWFVKILVFFKILVFVKILSQCRRRKVGKFQSLEVREQAPSHLKTLEKV